ncbi:MAG: hypothetical protein RL513_661 [Pseudomonadota bacterium]
MAPTPALRLYAGPRARAHIAQHGLSPQDIGVVPGAAGGPKGLVLGPLDQFIFGHWLAQSAQPVHLVGASIGAWRLATACLPDTVAALQRLSQDYIHQSYEIPPGRRAPTADHVSERFGEGLRGFYGGRVQQVLSHPRYRLHVVAARGRHVLRREHPVGTPLGYLGAFLSNAVHRKALGAWLERVVFSAGEGALPFDTRDYPTRRVALTADNFFPAVQASCSIPFALRAVTGIPGSLPGAHWDGGLTDYHLHLDYRPQDRTGSGAGLVLYPHFQKAVVPGWLDKGLRWRHRATPFLENMLVLAPNPAWVAQLANGKLPDRTDFTRYGTDLAARARNWNAAVSASQQLADEFAQWLQRPDPSRVEAL